MRDKLAEVIYGVIYPEAEWDIEPSDCTAASLKTADAVLSWLREHLGSDEVVTDAARAMAAEINFSFDGFGEISRSKYLRQSRAALSSIMEQSDGR